MPLFGFKKSTPAAPAAQAAAATSTVVPAPSAPVSPVSGALTLRKDEAVSLVKTPLLTATVSWPNTTDYDVFALVRYKDGSTVTVSQFGTKDHPNRWTPKTPDGAVVHLGDVQRGGGELADETIEIRLNPDIVAVVPVVYSAQSNGTGSFRRYKVSMSVSNGAGDTVIIDASDASNNDRVYTCVPGIILNGDTVTVKKLEKYSKPSSEYRPALDANLNVVMDAGPYNAAK